MTAVRFAVIALVIASSTAMQQNPSGPINTAIQTMAGPTVGGTGATTNTANVPSTMPVNNFGQTNQMQYNPYPSNSFPQQNYMGQQFGYPSNNFAGMPGMNGMNGMNGMPGMNGMNGMNMPGMGMAGMGMPGMSNMGMQGQQQEQPQNGMSSLFPFLAFSGNDAARNMAMMSALTGNRGGNQNMLGLLAMGGMGDTMQQALLYSGLGGFGGRQGGAMGSLPMWALLGGDMNNMLPMAMLGMGQGGQSGQGSSGFGQTGQSGFGSAGQSFGQNSMNPMGAFGSNPALLGMYLGGGF